MAEGLRVPRPRAGRKPLSDQPRLISNEVLVLSESTPPSKEGSNAVESEQPKHIGEVIIANPDRKSSSDPAYIRVKLFPAPLGDPRKFIVRDSKGVERELDPVNQLIQERRLGAGTADSQTIDTVNNQYGGGKPRAETLDRLRAENNSVKRR